MRSALLALTPGVPTWINGVPVTRLPCAGVWFSVGVHEDYPCVTMQTLRLADAISRVKSGHFPRLATCRVDRAQRERDQAEHDAFLVSLRGF